MADRLINPLYCLKCRKEIQGDAAFCPYCGHDQSSRPEPAPEKIIDEPIVGLDAPQRYAPPAPEPVRYEAPPVVIHQTVQRGTSPVVAILAALGVSSLLASPLGCFIVPILALVALGVLSLMGSALGLAGLIITGILRGFWPLIVAGAASRWLWLSSKSEPNAQKAQLLFTYALAASTIGICGTIINLIVLSRGH